MNPDPAQCSGLKLACLIKESGPYNKIGFALHNRTNQRLQGLDVMLTIPIELYRYIISFILRIDIACLYSAANSKVLNQMNRLNVIGVANLSCRICRTIVDDNIIQLKCIACFLVRQNRLIQPKNIGLFIIRWYNEQNLALFHFSSPSLKINHLLIA